MNTYRALLWLLTLLPACTHSGLVFEANQDPASDDAGPAAAADASTDAGDAGREPDAARDDGGLIEGDAGSEPARALAAHEQSCTVRDEGAFCWGRNSDGQLGVGIDSSPAFAPRHLEHGAPYTQLCAAETHSCGLRPDGHLDCWGGNAKGELGVGDQTARDEPTAVHGGLVFKSVSCGGELTCAVSKDERLYCWGDNFEGQIGLNDAFGSPNVLEPAQVSIERGIAQVSVGQGHVCALTNAGALYCWGRNTHGQLGLGRAPQQTRVPMQLPGSATYVSIAAGQEHTCAVRKDRHLFCWGYTLDGLIGTGETSAEDVREPVQVGSLADYQSAQANWFHTCALRTGGVLMCWGRNIEGQLGVGDTALREEPTLVSGLDTVSAFAVGHFHTCATRMGAVYCWGKNDEGQLGLGNDERHNVPTRVSF
jgi:alpha-tubulin suppressor-like RCC1 family protein